jgi:hypothetical protein
MTARQFTLVMAYYENPCMLVEQFAHLRRLGDNLGPNLHVRIVDDGSPESPAIDQCCGMFTRNYGLGGLGSFETWRMQVDVRWNQDACRNVGVRESPTDWILLTDMDHVVPPETWRALMLGKLREDTVYRFSRKTAPELEEYKPHPNSWALTKEMYWRIGGYDEALAGHYGTDGDFLVRARRVAGEPVQLKEWLVRYPREVISDASTRTLERKTPEDKSAVAKIIAARSSIPDWAPIHFSFPCVRVL